jgi:rhodanese-related sulfurtransferase
MREFSALELDAYLQSSAETPLLLDVRQPWEFDICRIDNSELIPMAQIPDRISSLDPTRETVVICRHGVRSRRVGLYLEQSGFSNVINLSGGVAQWAQTVDPQMPTY